VAERRSPRAARASWLLRLPWSPSRRWLLPLLLRESTARHVLAPASTSRRWPSCASAFSRDRIIVSRRPDPTPSYRWFMLNYHYTITQ
jgi:hypothetical protein